MSFIGMEMEQHRNGSGGYAEIPVNLENATRPAAIPEVGICIG